MTESYRHIANDDEYEFGCPEGTWTARLDQKVWGKSVNLLLYFSDVTTGRKYWFSVFRNPSTKAYTTRDNSHDFHHDAEPGDVFELTTKKTKAGNPNLISARKIMQPTGEP